MKSLTIKYFPHELKQSLKIDAIRANKTLSEYITGILRKAARANKEAA